MKVIPVVKMTESCDQGEELKWKSSSKSVNVMLGAYFYDIMCK